MPLLPVVGVRRRLGARQRLLAPQLTIVGASVGATTRLVSSGESLIHQMYQSGSFAGWRGQLPERRGDVNAGQHLLHVDTKHTSSAGCTGQLARPFATGGVGD
jgi:hypothetical protein